jgi:hypothetical protein
VPDVPSLKPGAGRPSPVHAPGQSRGLPLAWVRSGNGSGLAWCPSKGSAGSSQAPDEYSSASRQRPRGRMGAWVRNDLQLIAIVPWPPTRSSFRRGCPLRGMRTKHEKSTPDRVGGAEKTRQQPTFALVHYHRRELLDDRVRDGNGYGQNSMITGNTLGGRSWDRPPTWKKVNW